jgi:hypothetical protein
MVLCIRDMATTRDTRTILDTPTTRGTHIRDTATTRDTCTRDTRIRDTAGGMDTVAGADTDTTGVADDMFGHTLGRRGDGHTAMAAGTAGTATSADS